MKTKDFWIWQAAEVAEPWAMKLVMTKERKKFTADVELYADWLPNSSKVFRFADVPLTRNDRLIKEIGHVCKTFGHELTKADVLQIEEELKFFRNQFYF